MPQLRIPGRYHGGLMLLAELPDKTSLALMGAFETEQPTIDVGQLIDHVAAQVSDIAKDDLTEIVSALESLSSARPSFNLDIPEFTEGIAGSEDLELSVPQRDVLRGRLKELLGRRSLVATAKATSLLMEHAHVYQESRVITDIRPVFADGPDDGPVAAVIIHSLRITYQQDGNLRDFYVGLDTADVKQLREALERATEKEVSLRRRLQTAGMTYLEVTE